jgi:hypothetical protein
MFGALTDTMPGWGRQYTGEQRSELVDLVTAGQSTQCDLVARQRGIPGEVIAGSSERQGGVVLHALDDFWTAVITVVWCFLRQRLCDVVVVIIIIIIVVVVVVVVV